jgi:hypothetical protein
MWVNNMVENEKQCEICHTKIDDCSENNKRLLFLFGVYLCYKHFIILGEVVRSKEWCPEDKKESTWSCHIKHEDGLVEHTISGELKEPIVYHNTPIVHSGSFSLELRDRCKDEEIDDIWKFTGGNGYEIVDKPFLSHISWYKRWFYHLRWMFSKKYRNSLRE